MSDIVQDALAKFDKTSGAWSDIYSKARDDLFFLSDEDGAQWNSQDYNDRVLTGRPALTIDQLSQFIHQVGNDIRMNTPTVNVIPDSSGASEETADVYKGIIRTIEYKSGADDVYDTASLNAIKCSIGFIRVDHEYCDDMGFEQDLVIKRVINPLAVFIDDASIECDGRDAKYAFVVEPMRVSEFKALYPDKAPVSFEPSRLSKKDDEFLNIAEYFVLEEHEKTIGLREDGEVEEADEEYEYSSTRVIKKIKVKRYKLSGADVLEETTFPGKYIPIVPVYGEEAWKNGQRHLFSLIRKAKQAQQMFNYWKSLETEILMKQPNAPIMVPEGAIEDYQEDWKTPSKSMALRYRYMDDKGNPMPQPQRLEPPVMPNGVLNAARECVESIKATIGMYNASLGQRSNEQSGKAIMARQREGDVATYHFADNLVRSITQVGRILVCAIPEIYDTPRIMKMLGEEGEIRDVGINGAMAEAQEAAFDLKKGKYSVRVETGAPYTTRRQEAAEFFTQVVSRQPELMNVMGDLLFKNMDFAGAQEMASRMKKLIDPKLTEENAEIDPEKEQLKQVIQEGQGILQQLQAENQQLQQELKSKQADLQLRAQDSQVKLQDSQTKAILEEQKMQLEARQAELDYRIKEQELALKQAELSLKEKELVQREESMRINQFNAQQGLGNQAQ